MRPTMLSVTDGQTHGQTTGLRQ